MIRVTHFGLVVLSVLAVGCVHVPKNRTAPQADSVKFLAESPRRDPIEAPRDGKILVYVSGDVREPGPHWIPEDADILTVEQVAGAGDEGVITTEPKRVVVRRQTGGRLMELRYDLRRRTRLQKQAIGLKHGDSIIFPWTNR